MSRSLAQFLTTARNAGVKDSTTSDLADAAARLDEVESVLDHLYELSPLADSLTPGSTADIRQAARDEAALAAERHQLEEVVAERKLQERAIYRQWATPTNINALLADIAPTYAHAQGALHNLADRWGTENPTAEQVLATATATEIKEYQQRGKHQRTITSIKRLFTEFLASEKIDAQSWLVLDLDRAHYQGHYEPPLKFAPALDWFLDDNGAITTLEDARARLNEFMSASEKNAYMEQRNYTHPKPEFHGKYTLKPDVKQPELLADGRPTDPNTLATHNDVVTMWNLDN